MFQPPVSSATHFVNPPDEAKHDHLSEQILGSESFMTHRKSGKNPVSMNMESNHIHMLPSSTFPRSNSQFSTLSEASKNSDLKYVYQRNKNQKKYAIAATGQSSIYKENCGLSSAVKRSIQKSGSNHCCSSSKSNLNVDADFAHINAKTIGECSSRLVSAENQMESIAEKDFCISFLTSRGLLGKGHIRTSGVGESTIKMCPSRTCKTCGGRENTTNLLICDDCDSAFHAWCCRPRVNDIPTEEWFCNSCEKKKQKFLKEMKLQKLQNITEGEVGNSSVDASNVVLTCFDMMLLNIKPHKTEVRIGKGFQADVPEWSEPSQSPSDSDFAGEALEIGLSESERLPIPRQLNPARVNPIGNWLQCREVIRGIRKDIDGTICGKWRRAPLSQVQSDDWDCFSAVFWDPAHADCAAPQELDTVEVLKQLKYIQMPKPGKCQRVSNPRKMASLQGPSKRARNP